MKAATRKTKTKKSKKLTLKDRLSRLTYIQAAKLLGPEGQQLIRRGASYDNIDIDRDVYFRGDLFRLKLRGIGERGKDVVATITTMAEAKNRLRMNCTACETVCEHIGAAVSLILEEKTALGLAAAPDERRPIETLERGRVARTGAARSSGAGENREVPPAIVRSTTALGRLHDHQRTFGQDLSRGPARRRAGDSFCSCPDFRTNTLGTCKHIMHVLHRVKRRFPVSARKKPYRNSKAFVHVLYGEEVSLRLQLPDRPKPELVEAVGALADGPIDDMRRLVDCIKRLEQLGHGITVYPDAEELIERRLFELHMRGADGRDSQESGGSPASQGVVEGRVAPLSARRDRVCRRRRPRRFWPTTWDLGKTIQGVGTAEILAREAGIGRVLVVCPASLKSQWRNEIHRFSDRTVQLVTGTAAERARQYDNDAFFTVCNYEQVLRDILAIERVALGLDRSGRRAADQELGVENRADHERASLEVRTGAKRHAVGEPARRAVFGGAVRRRPPPAARLPLLSSSPRRR